MTQTVEEKHPGTRLFGKIPLSDALIIAAFTVVAYALVFIYKLGYFKVFGLPVQFITFNAIEVLSVVAGLLGTFWTLFGAINVVFSFLPKDMSPSIERRLQFFLPFLVLFLALFVLYEGLWKEWLGLLILVVVLGLIMFATPFLTRRYKGSYLEKMEALDQESAQSEDIWEDTRSLGYWTGRFLAGTSLLPVVVYGFIGLYVVYHFGRASALNQKVFRVASTSPETVVLVMIDDLMICAPFDRNSREVEPSFIMLEVPGEGNVEFRLQEVGPLRLREDAISRTVTPTATSTPTPAPTPTSTAAPAPTSTTTLSPTASPTPL